MGAGPSDDLPAYLQLSSNSRTLSSTLALKSTRTKSRPASALASELASDRHNHFSSKGGGADNSSLFLPMRSPNNKPVKRVYGRETRIWKPVHVDLVPTKVICPNIIYLCTLPVVIIIIPTQVSTVKIKKKIVAHIKVRVAWLVTCHQQTNAIFFFAPFYWTKIDHTRSHSPTNNDCIFSGIFLFIVY